LPLHPGLSAADVDRVCETLARAIAAEPSRAVRI
jgi:dTDP-4-amino-4,6-dideoxygalactose transaminase